MRIFTLLFKSLLFTSLVFGANNLFAQQLDSTKRTVAAPATVNAIDKGITIRGTIKDAATNKPLAGINISVFEYSAAITGDKGEFTIKVPNINAVLTVSGQGFQSKDVPLKGRKSISVSLFEDSYNSIYDIAKTPFGQTPQNQSVNSLASISTQGGWETNNETTDSYLQGKVAGLNAIRRSGTPGIGANLFLRGYSSLYGTNKPLIVVDGMIYDDNHYGNSLIGGHVYNPLEQIDFKDIDNITVIKDGSSIYGTRGANGVILISTAHAPELATRIDFGVDGGFNFTPSNLPVLKAADYRTYLSDVLRTSGLTDAQIQAQPYMNDAVGSSTYAQYHNNTDWQKQVFKNSYNTNYYLKVSGGDEIAKYALSLGYLGNDGITQETNLARYNTRFNADLNLTKKFTASASLSFTYAQQNLRDQGTNYKINPIYASQIKSPLVGVHSVNAQGVESPNLTDADIFNISNPAALIGSAQETNQSYRFFGIVNFKYQFNRYLNLQTGIGITSDKIRENTFIPRAGVVNDTLSNAIADSRLGTQVQRLYSIYNDTHLSFDRTFNRIHHVSANLGFRYNSDNTQDNYSLGYNSATDQLISVTNSVSALRRTGGDLGKWNWLNNYLGLDYQLLGKYLFSYNMAVDGSSRFGTQIPGVLSISGSKFAVLPSIAAGWLISSEKFMSNVNFIELLKLRASYGLTGNDDIGNYTARQYYVSQNLLGTEGLVRGNIGNPQLQWERNKKANIGIDASFLNERLSVSIDAYQNTTDKMIVYEPQPTTSGLTYAITNNGGMRTKGLEMAVNARIINHSNFKWDVGMNIAAYRNKITELPGTQMLTTYAGGTILTAQGLPANLFYGYKTNGVYTSDAEAAAAGTNHQGISIVSSTGALVKLKGGDVRFVDTNGDNIIDSRDMQVIGNPNPDFTGGFNTRFAYKRFTLDALFTFSKGNDVYNYTRRVLESESGYQNQTLAVVNRWRADGQVTDIPKATYGDPMGNSRFSDRWIEDGSYLRLRTVSVSYNVPVKTKFLKSVRVYLTGNNIFTMTKYLGYDPEFSATESLLTQGIDTNLEPIYRSVQVGVRVGL
ncbi:SusC/RagA family TonB-linked outer membrane protein [Mucilaginibacter arboris]|uniref:SusC/RagA family TonB-linked outer membrane protein n=1 Tax=Mucilaginibacter arboris TaxID=2682090 RepID=A0A7K1SZF8_9SPHI|nr:SusC/RagA family TonB-linked outer membrane protein [Mucilaginibacter arboris]MVN22706.1 SusC/RagA family TonB-linked outer membrane protein [Mucilaginibacter arboris]